MNLLACLILIASGLLLMIIYAVGPFANEPWLKLHFRFKRLNSVTQTSLKTIAFLLSIACSMQLIGIFS